MSSKTFRTAGGLILIALVALVWLWGQSGDRDSGGSTSSATLSSPTHSATSSATSPATSSTAATDPDSGLRWIAVSALPAEAREVLAAIDDGGPFRYEGKDGSTFGNFEGILPKKPRGYYHEYTVDTPGATNRGTRRIITGEGGRFYWTADHYEHFSRIRR